MKSNDSIVKIAASGITEARSQNTRGAILLAWDCDDKYVLNAVGETMCFSEFEDDIAFDLDGVLVPTEYTLDGNILDYQLLISYKELVKIIGEMVLFSEAKHLPININL